MEPDTSVAERPPGDARLSVEIELDSTPIRGVVWQRDRSRAQPFSGWLELASAIEAARTACQA